MNELFKLAHDTIKIYEQRPTTDIKNGRKRVAKSLVHQSIAIISKPKQQFFDEAGLLVDTTRNITIPYSNIEIKEGFTVEILSPSNNQNKTYTVKTIRLNKNPATGENWSIKMQCYVNHR